MNDLIIDILQEILLKIKADVLLNDYLSLDSENPLINISCNDLAVISIGKAAYEMFLSIEDYFLQKETKTPILNSLLITKKPDNPGYTDLLLDISMLHNMNIIFADHPFPDEESLYAGKTIYEFIKKHKDKTILFLISGGGSSLAECLYKIPLIKYNNLIKVLMNNGIDINQLNVVRKHLSKLKGGYLLSYIKRVRLKANRKKVLATEIRYMIKQLKNTKPLSNCYSMILSDIHTKEYHNVSSGLTFKDNSDVNQAKEIINKYGVINAEFYFKYLLETPKNISSIPYYIVGDNELMLSIIQNILSEKGYNVIIDKYILNENAALCGLNIGCQIYRHKKIHQKPCAVIYGGEATVEVRGNGIGGRILETALAISIEIRGLGNVRVLAVASDGKDGNSKAMGVIVDGYTYDNILKTGITPERYLRNNDSYTALLKGATIIPSYHTGTNLNDFIIVFIETIE